MDQTSTNKKLIIGWFTLTCSEDSTILLTELLNEHFAEWKKLVEFRYFKALKSKNEFSNFDVAFIEGAVSSESQAEKAKKIRDQAKYVVAVGACACTGLPSASRNNFTDDKITERIQWYMKNFNYNKKVQKLSDVIKVDDMINGCPMNPTEFSKVLQKYLEIFKII